MGQTEDSEAATDLVKANQRIRDLEREVKRLQDENAVLTAAERFFSSKKRPLRVHRAVSRSMLRGGPVPQARGLA